MVKATLVYVVLGDLIKNCKKKKKLKIKGARVKQKTLMLNVS